ncbi:hypothetical protein [Frankia sp. Cr1]|uniref:hypothetical protein n=1 Tax=Frankia sp. Cr1 TaxID=3073931 RepID=UPI002AD35811|nr:hypothetical protein [Frankia sp. Cr1]
MGVDMLLSPEFEEIRVEIAGRWQLPDWQKRFPWFPRPVTVKILFYADGSIQFDGGPFFGLKQVIATLTANHYPWVRFEVTTVHRLGDPSAQHQGLDLAAALALDSFDELWIYSIQAQPQLTATEIAAVTSFTDSHQGGVLITGDHANLGNAVANIPRAGKMRQQPAPPAAPPLWNSTLQAGPNGIYEFDDQSDGIPQPLRLAWRWAGLIWRAPHPLLCSPLGPINVFPDHQHEGEALAPSPTPATEWPSGPGGPVAAEVIAWGRIADTTSNTVGREVGVLSVYNGHEAAVGRIVADSTWHHHFDINLRGLPGDPTHPGFVTPGTADWAANAKKIEHFFVNCGIWLAPPRAQKAMRSAAFWMMLWSDAVLEALSSPVHPVLLGRYAYDALGRLAPQCAVFHWFWDLLPHNLQQNFVKYVEKGDPPPLFEVIAGTVTRQLADAFQVSASRQIPPEPPAVEDMEEKLTGVAQRALGELVANREEALRDAQALADFLD